MWRKLVLSASALAAASVASAAESPGLEVTIYNADLALVRDVRQMDIGKGRQRLEFKDVSSDIRPETVTLAADGVDIVEQNYDFDLLTPSKLMEKAVGQQIQIVRTNPGNGQQVTETATVLAANEGVVLKIGDRIEVLRDDGVPTRVIFDKVPENLRARPTLSVTVDSDRMGARLATLSYLTPGLGWRADYVALYNEADSKIDVQGWVTLTNSSGASRASVVQIAPSLFTVNTSGLAAGYITRVSAGNVQTFEPIFTVRIQASFPVPIDLGPPTDQVYLILFGTGIRHADQPEFPRLSKA